MKSANRRFEKSLVSRMPGIPDHRRILGNLVGIVGSASPHRTAAGHLHEPSHGTVGARHRTLGERRNELHGLGSARVVAPCPVSRPRTTLPSTAIYWASQDHDAGATKRAASQPDKYARRRKDRSVAAESTERFTREHADRDCAEGARCEKCCARDGTSDSRRTCQPAQVRPSPAPDSRSTRARSAPTISEPAHPAILVPVSRKARNMADCAGNRSVSRKVVPPRHKRGTPRRTGASRLIGSTLTSRRDRSPPWHTKAQSQ